ncbi:MAG TPA: cytochrome c [Solirubrobacteraceae bacterium]|jgi:cytochrome c6|nr:cytochrome c [Solirubrobacteraceae bacterium]
MAQAVVLGFFTVLGLAVVLVAMRGGPRGVRTSLEAGRRRPMRVGEFAVAAIIMLFGLVVPAIVLIGGQATAGPGGTTLSADLAEGRQLFNDRCATCHALDDANAVGRVGPDLDVLAPTAGLTLNAIREGRARGQGQMPARLLDGADARKVARYIEEVAGR